MADNIRSIRQIVRLALHRVADSTPGGRCSCREPSKLPLMVALWTREGYTVATTLVFFRSTGGSPKVENLDAKNKGYQIGVQASVRVIIKQLNIPILRGPSPYPSRGRNKTSLVER